MQRYDPTVRGSPHHSFDGGEMLFCAPDPSERGWSDELYIRRYYFYRSFDHLGHSLGA